VVVLCDVEDWLELGILEPDLVLSLFTNAHLGELLLKRGDGSGFSI